MLRLRDREHFRVLREFLSDEVENRRPSHNRAYINEAKRALKAAEKIEARLLDQEAKVVAYRSDARAWRTHDCEASVELTRKMLAHAGDSF